MAKQHLSTRLEADTVAAVDAWAQAHGVTRTDAVERLLSVGIAAGERDLLDNQAVEDDDGVVASLRAHVDDLRAEVDLLTSQVERKDEQIARLMTMAGNAQALQAAAEARALEAAQGDTDGDFTGASDVLDQDTEDVTSEAVAPPTDASEAVLSGDAGAVGQEVEAEPARRHTWRERLARWILGK